MIEKLTKAENPFEAVDLNNMERFDFMVCNIKGVFIPAIRFWVTDDVLEDHLKPLDIPLNTVFKMFCCLRFLRSLGLENISNAEICFKSYHQFYHLVLRCKEAYLVEYVSKKSRSRKVN